MYRNKATQMQNMRILNGVLMFTMMLFAVVQYNDPDGILWMIIYLVPAAWAGVATFKQDLIVGRSVGTLLLISISVAVIGVFYFWPTTAGWWRNEVWWEEETAREGIGMMVVLLVLSIVWFSRPRSTTAT